VIEDIRSRTEQALGILRSFDRPSPPMSAGASAVNLAAAAAAQDDTRHTQATEDDRLHQDVNDEMTDG
jgi:hypothetical protein